MTDVTVFILELNISFVFLLGSPSGHAMGSSCVWYVMVTAALSYTVRWKDKSAVTLHRSVFPWFQLIIFRYFFIYICYVFNGLNLNKFRVWSILQKSQQTFIMIYFSWRKSKLRGFICIGWYYQLTDIAYNISESVLHLQCWKFLIL